MSGRRTYPEKMRGRVSVRDDHIDALKAENKRLREKVAYYINEARYHASWHRASVQEFYEYRAALTEKEPS